MVIYTLIFGVQDSNSENFEFCNIYIKKIIDTFLIK